MGRKPTVNDIARVAGVSLATVDRVLNRRPGVRSVTIEKVNNAVAELGFVRDAAAVNLARRRFFEMQFVLPETQNEFVLALMAAIEEQRGKLLHQRASIDTRLVPPFDPEAIVELLDAMDPAETDGVAVFGPETPSVRDAVGRARARGIPVVALVSDLPSSDRTRFVGIDNVAAGRTAAQLMGRFVHDGGRVLVITGSRLARDHIERRSGFDAVMSRDFPDLEVVASIEGRDDPAVILDLLPDVFKAYPDLRGVYSSAAGNPGLIEYLRKAGMAHDVVVVAHELTPSSRLALTDGTFDAIISQDTGHLVRSATRVLMAAADNSPLNDTQERIRIDIYLRDNMPTL
ncbi:MAG: LacI family DNA-binding transcriptional regulator [Pseudomonadota bacterium]